MKSLLITLLLTLAALGARAQGSVTVYQGSDIDKVLNAKRNRPQEQTQPAEQKQAVKPTAPTENVEHHEEAAAETEHVAAKHTKLVKKRVLVKISDEEMLDKGAGFRIQVYSGGNTREARQEAERAGHKVKAAIPELPVYVHFYTPRWGCRVGNFRTYQDAQRVLARIHKLGFKQAIILRKPGQLGEKKKDKQKKHESRD